MGFRIVVIGTHSKLELSLNYLVFKTVNEVKRINIDEIQTLIIESTAVSITSALLSELIAKKVKIIFCDEKKNPVSELVPYNGNTGSFKCVNNQMQCSMDIKNKVWKEVIKEKINNQALVLSSVDKKASEELILFANDVLDGDITNREGHAAKYYFNRIFGDDFTRNNDNKKNAYLNYGYTLLLSQVNRCVVSKGYLTQLGIHHKNEFNQFNLSCDFVEPLRPFVDRKAFTLNDDNFKDELVKMLAETYIVDGQKQTLSNAIYIYITSLINALNSGDVSVIKFIKENEQ